MDAVKHFNPNFVGQLMDYLAGQGISPQLVVGEYFDSNPATLTNWIGSVYSNMNSASVNIRAFDFALRQALKNACDQYHYSFNFDTRDIFQSGIVDGAGGSGLNAITFINNHDFRDSDQPVLEDPILAYAYILTNNKVGLPCVFYPEYFGIAPDNYPVVNLKSRIDSLIQIHKNNIYLAPQVEYLNRHSTSRQSNYISGSADKALIYQISGGISNKDVLVAINFGNTTLKVDHELNTADAPVGTQFNRIMGSSPFSYGVVSASSGGVPNSMYIQLPPRSFSVWLAGGLVLPLELTRFEAVNTAKSVRLNWETQAENQVLEYILERSESGNAFAPIAAVPAKNSPSAAYDYTDPWVASQGIRYYRLRMVDMDGQVEYSPVRTVVREATLENRIRLFPNPAEKEISISWDIPQFTRLQVFSVLGQPVLDMDVTGGLTQEISLTGIQPGVYYAILSDASGAREILRFVRK
ncbi:MAG: T9SS type A sorting domain-containing protein, partial [Lewinella sp.]|nr:T9SS type A sorting domain-containing protein [Lewinella sp.]